ncbi:CGNR zinc finger domain-containing protein [Streptomyces sp. NPDC056500]|uniref:CGNR zinc finger domain-containing protein n=1 Tax=Streptomyces sp. NPDC056500 TaxID=3345840 RepID=UPI00368AE8E5
MEPLRSAGSARHSVDAMARRTAALINVLTGTEGPEHLEPTADPEAVGAVLRAYGEVASDDEHGAAERTGRAMGALDPLALSADDLIEMREAALRLRTVFAAEGVDEAAARLNELLALTEGRLRLSAHRGASPWHPHLDGDDDGPWGEWLLASSALALTVLIWDRQRPPGGICASTTCRNVFLTQGSGPVRRYCSRRCATRERVAAHRRAQRTDR